MSASYLRMNSHEARRRVLKSRQWRLRKSLMRNQGMSPERAKELVNEMSLVRPRKA